MNTLPLRNDDGLPARIGVRMVNGGASLVGGPGVAILRLATPHAHAAGESCPACLATCDIRSRLWNLVEEAKAGLRPSFSTVLVDTLALPDATPLRDALVPGRVPARSLAHHMVARRFVLLD
jgi:hypothetical protein